jgi:alkylated DNA nucleotide flippase Atl1
VVAHAQLREPPRYGIPFHRVINAHDDFGGYGAGFARKQWLIEEERQHRKGNEKDEGTPPRYGLWTYRKSARVTKPFPV